MSEQADKPGGKRRPSLLFEVIVYALVGGVMAAFVGHALAATLEQIFGDPTILVPPLLAAGAVIGASIPIIRRCFGK
jgi:hypothetical protein